MNARALFAKFVLMRWDGLQWLQRGCDEVREVGLERDRRWGHGRRGRWGECGQYGGGHRSGLLLLAHQVRTELLHEVAHARRAQARRREQVPDRRAAWREIRVGVEAVDRGAVRAWPAAERRGRTARAR